MHPGRLGEMAAQAATHLTSWAQELHHTHLPGHDDAAANTGPVDADYSGDARALVVAFGGKVHVILAPEMVAHATLKVDGARCVCAETKGHKEVILVGSSDGMVRKFVLDPLPKGKVLRPGATETASALRTPRDSGKQLAKPTGKGVDEQKQGVASGFNHFQLAMETPLDPALGIAAHDREVTSVAMTRDARFFLSGGNDGRVCLFSVANGEPVCSLSTGGAPMRAVAFGLENRLAAAAGHDGAVRIWDVSEATRGNKEKLDPNLHPSAVLTCEKGCDPHPDFTHIRFGMKRTQYVVVAASSDGAGRAWDIADVFDPSHKTKTPRDHPAAAPDWRVGSQSESHAPRLQPLQFFRHATQVSHVMPSTGMACVAVGENGETLATVGEDGTMRLWVLSKAMEEKPNTMNPARIVSGGGPGAAAAFSSHGPANVAFVTRYGEISTWGVPPRRGEKGSMA